MILENLNAAYRYGSATYLRCPIIPGINDTDELFAAIAALAEQYPKLKGIEFLPYHDMGNSKRVSIGQELTLEGLKSVLPETHEVWTKLLTQKRQEHQIVN